MDALTLAVLAAQNPRRALKWPNPMRQAGDTWSKFCWCAECIALVSSKKSQTLAVLAERTPERYVCNSCGDPVNFND